MSARRSSERRHVDFRFRCEPEAGSWRSGGGGGRPEAVPLLTFSPSPNVEAEAGGSSTGPSSPTSLSASSSPQGTPQRPCSSPQGMYTAADLLRGCTDLQYADSGVFSGIWRRGGGGWRSREEESECGSRGGRIDCLLSVSEGIAVLFRSTYLLYYIYAVSLERGKSYYK